ncbi:MAG: hypothetical protein WCW84_06700 [Sulfurimonas sp.]|jgi:hypothetical protein
MLVTKPYGTVYALIKTPIHLKNIDKIRDAEYFRFRLHGANVRLRELGGNLSTQHNKGRL